MKADWRQSVEVALRQPVCAARECAAAPEEAGFAFPVTRRALKSSSLPGRVPCEGPARGRRAGRCSGFGLVAVRLAAAGPDEGVAFAVLVVEEVGVDRGVEARVVQLDREIVAALVGALRPGGPDLGPADIDPMAGGVVVGPVGLGDDADALGLDAQGDDLALELAAGLLERTDVGHVTSPCWFRARD